MRLVSGSVALLWDLRRRSQSVQGPISFCRAVADETKNPAAPACEPLSLCVNSKILRRASWATVARGVGQWSCPAQDGPTRPREGAVGRRRCSRSLNVGEHGFDWIWGRRMWAAEMSDEWLCHSIYRQPASLSVLRGVADRVLAPVSTGAVEVDGSPSQLGISTELCDVGRGFQNIG